METNIASGIATHTIIQVFIKKLNASSIKFTEAIPTPT